MLHQHGNFLPMLKRSSNGPTRRSRSYRSTRCKKQPKKIHNRGNERARMTGQLVDVSRAIGAVSIPFQFKVPGVSGKSSVPGRLEIAGREVTNRDCERRLNLRPTSTAGKKTREVSRSRVTPRNTRHGNGFTRASKNRGQLVRIGGSTSRKGPARAPCTCFSFNYYSKTWIKKYSRNGGSGE